MKAIFINYSHPETKHVSGVRVKAFADVLAEKGHKIIFMTKCLEEKNGAIKKTEQVYREIQKHNWSKPYHLEIVPVQNTYIQKIQNNKFFMPIRKVNTAWNFLRHGGVYHDWTTGSKEYWKLLSKFFKPDIVWATFLPTDSWCIAQKIAKLSNCPWIMDIKDSWHWFIPKPIQKILANRFCDAAALTSNCKLHIEQMKPYFSMDSEVIYSGFSEEFLIPPPLIPHDNLIITLSGSFNNNLMAEYLEILALFSLKNKTSRHIVVNYAGAKHNAFEEITNHLTDHKLDFKIMSYLNIHEFLNLCRNSHVNTYIRVFNSTAIHHKSIELLSCGRPLLVYTGETEEVKQLIHNAGGELICCNSKEDLFAAFNELTLRPTQGFYFYDPDKLIQFTWKAQADILVRFIKKKSEEVQIH